MIIESLQIEGAKKLTFPVHNDSRGFFREWFKESQFQKVDSRFIVKQANMSHSKKNVIRGIHFSTAPEGQAKIVTVVSGHMTDILVDLRIGSPTYLEIDEIELTHDSGHVVYVPSGVGHGFIARSKSVKVVYLTSGEYSPDFERSVFPMDSNLGIDWKLAHSNRGVISAADKFSPTLLELNQNNLLPKYA